jgi:hypothetical protein
MKVSVGKPVLAAISVACIAVPAATGVASAATPAPTPSPVRLVAAAAPVDPNLALLKLLTFPIHNAYGIAVGVGTAANAGLNLALLPVSIASFVAVNQTDKIPGYVQTVQTNLANAIPGIIKSIQAEVAYDQGLFGTLGVTQAAQSRPSAHDVNAIVAAASGTPLLNLLTFPIHNAYGIAVGVGTAANSVLNLALLPVSIAGFVITNQTDKIPGYVQTVQAGLANAIPGIIKSIQAEVSYDQHLFSSIGIAAAKQPAMAALEAPQVKKIAAGTEADAPKALAAGDSSKDSTPTDSAPAKDSKPSDTTPAKDSKPSDTTPAKDSTPADSTPAKDSTPDKDGKPGKTGVHHQGGAATGTDGANSTPSKTDGTPSKHTGAGKHRAAAGAGSTGAGSTGHGRHAKK